MREIISMRQRKRHMTLSSSLHLFISLSIVMSRDEAEKETHDTLLISSSLYLRQRND